MNLKISYNWLKEYVKFNGKIEDFVREFSLKSQTIDKIERVSPKFKGIITARILDIKNHPNADKLNLVEVDLGKTKQVVVCGAPNIQVGQIVPLAIEGAEVVDADGKLFKIKKVKIRDVESNGMLCSQKELGLGDDHSGIMILPNDLSVGKPLEEILDLNDYNLEIEITSNRPDAMSVIGLAREAAAVLGVKDSIKVPNPDFKSIIDGFSLLVEVREPKLCPRYNAIVMTGVRVGPSPLWLQTRLLASGLWPINNLADITNYVLLEYGRPMHVFDYEKIKGKKIIVRKAKTDEKILALDGRMYELNPDHLVIADSKEPVAIAGIMGGELSGATQDTRTIVFESAAFDPVLIRKTARELNLHSESSDLFEKNLEPQTTFVGLLRAIELTQDLAGGKIASPIIDVCSREYIPKKIKLSTENIKRCLGVEIADAKTKNILESLGFFVKGSGKIEVTVPYWRVNDIEFEHDLVEEVARIYGYHNLPTQMPEGKIPAESKDLLFFLEDKIRNLLFGLGFSESYNYSMVSKQSLQKTNFSEKDAIKINNPLNEEMQYMRTTLLPGIFQNVSDNLNNFSEFKIFELSNVYLKAEKNALPNETLKLTGAVVAEKDTFFQLKGVSAFLLKNIGILGYEMRLTDYLCPLWQTGQCLDIYKNEFFIGQFGIVNSNILEKFGIKKPVGVFDFEIPQLARFVSTTKSFQAIPEFPAVTRDLAIIIDKKISWQEIKNKVNQTDELIVDIEYLSTFSDESFGKEKKSLAFRIIFRANNRTLKSEDADEVIKKVVQKLKDTFGAILR